ncbi:MAG: glycosyltransferase family 4 protein [Candidatus Thermoplasmatota archaeon]
MKVAMLGWEYPPFKVGGLGTHCYGLTQGLADKGVHIDFYMPKTKKRVKSDRENLRIIEVGETDVFPYDRPDDKELAGKFFDCVYRYNDLLVQKVKGTYDLVHCHDWLTIKAGVALKHKLGIPLVLTVHSTEYDRSGWIYPNQWFIDIEKEGMMQADVIIAVSNFTKKIIVEKYGIPSEKVHVIHNAVFPIGEGEKKNLVLFLGRLTLQKGPEFFLKTAKKVLEKEDTRFVIAGTGDMLPRLINQAVDLGIANKVIFTGKLSEEEVKHIYKIANVYVMPSVSEPFGITALEAISAGTPTIVSKASGVSEVFKNCFKVDFWDTDEMANKIIALLRYPPLRTTMVEHSKQEIDLFTWERVASRTLDVYNEVAEV